MRSARSLAVAWGENAVLRRIIISHLINPKKADHTTYLVRMGLIEKSNWAWRRTKKGEEVLALLRTRDRLEG